MNYIIFEDNNCYLLKPFIDLHPSFDLRVGVFTNIQRIKNLISKDDTIQLYVRERIKKIVKERYPDITVNPETYGPGIFLNGNCLWNSDNISLIKGDYSYSNENGLVAFSSNNNANIEDIEDLISDKSSVSSRIEIESIKYLWDVFDLLDKTIKLDTELLYKYKKGNLHPSVILVNQDNIIINEGSNISAGSVLDASEGPIILDEYSFIDIGSLIKGPVYLGKHSKINPGSKIRGPVSIGPYSKIGGEVEDSVVQGFSNKQHDGFLGHSYIGEWVNLGANTNTSDLKNNYSNIRMEISLDDTIETNKMFIGSIIGDFTKTAISTKLNSGTFIGTGSNVFDNSFMEKFIPSFSWGKENKVGLNRFLESCCKMMDRRDINMSEGLKERLIELYQK